MEILNVENLSFKYASGGGQVLSDVSFSVARGEFVTVCGATGSGKSTLLRMIKRELSPLGEKSGNIKICGVPQSEMSDIDAAKKIGFVFQHPEQQIVCDKVWHEIAFGLENLGAPQKVIRRRVAETAAYFGIEEIFYKKTAELSGGEKQLVALASVMAMEPELILLDEPTSRLDPIAVKEFISTLRRICRETGTTVVIVEHSLGDLLEISDKLLVLENGKVAAFGAPRDALAQLGATGSTFDMLPCAPKIYLGTGAFGVCPLGVTDGREYVENNFSNVVRAFEKAPAERSEKVALGMKNVFFRYNKSDRDVLSDLSFDVREGEIFAVLGGNGSGKTTALCAAAGLYRVYSGEIKIFGKKISEYKNQTLYDGCLTMLFQDVQTLFLKNTVREELADVGGKDFSLPYDISHLYDKHPYDLSGGEQQLVALGKVLLTKPRLLLLDEPTKGLDGGAKRRLSEVIKGLKASGVTVVIVTHDAEFAALTADRCALFFRGEIISSGEPREFFSSNGFYTTEASRMTRGYYDEAVTADDVVSLCRLNGRRA